MMRKSRSKRPHLHVEALEDRLCLSSLPAGTSTTPADAATQARLSAAYGQLPLSFEANQGQTDSRVNFLSRGAGYSLFLTPTKAVLSLKQGDSEQRRRHEDRRGQPRVPRRRPRQAGGREQLLHRQRPVEVAHQHPQLRQGRVPGCLPRHRPGLPRRPEAARVRLRGRARRRPPAPSGWPSTALTGKSLDAQGNLVLHTSGGDVVEHAPVVYQMVNGVQHAVASRFVLGRGGQVGFQVGRYDHSKPLVIDPVEAELLDLPRRQGQRQWLCHRRGQLRQRLHHGLYRFDQFPHQGPRPAVQRRRRRCLRDEAESHRHRTRLLHLPGRQRQRCRQWHRRGRRGQRLRDGLDDLGQLPDDEPPAGPPATEARTRSW